ncbi:N-acetyllactosaminide alpha-1,3-galactosyltransferase-like, partial [Lampetra fluviatilis]
CGHSGRSDVSTLTSWGAPILWSGTFESERVDRRYAGRQVAVGLTVFAIGRYLDDLLKDFLDSAEMHFLVGHRVTYYVVTDQPARIPQVALAANRAIVPVKVEKRPRWQDICMDRFKTIGELAETTARDESYLFCLDVDLRFTARWGPEVLSDRVAVLHTWFFKARPSAFTYERRVESAARVAPGEGDYYYHASVFGGRRATVAEAARAVFAGVARDRRAGVEAVWHDESHLNRYLIDVKPSKVLSPEYCWDETVHDPAVRVKRLVWVQKNSDVLRENP